MLVITHPYLLPVDRQVDALARPEYLHTPLCSSTSVTAPTPIFHPSLASHSPLPLSAPDPQPTSLPALCRRGRSVRQQSRSRPVYSGTTRDESARGGKQRYWKPVMRSAFNEVLVVPR
ncbi:hypothetical protein E2C01_004545 [Portunus trituberculatus]|uniref:Uncharacterized protein n=1 Tax=Portunus trituberculatus TaxID=210409 RepID=A0A5B7CQZ7_PORTR|nr:hypothetical protein [Portunus trituberculatus]